MKPHALRLFALIAIACLFGASIHADVVILTSGKTITGKVLQRDDDGVLFQMDYGTYRYANSLIKEVRADSASDVAETTSARRIPSWTRIVSTLATNEWAHELKQIPATVVETGVLRNVPYISFRCSSSGYEINIYGDLDEPAGVEIGVLNYLVKHNPARTNCLKLIESVLAQSGDKTIARNLSLKAKEIQKREGLTFETTLPDEADAYGGWWVSVYDEDMLGKARASGAELLEITQPKVEPKPQPVVQAAPAMPDTRWTPTDISYSRPSVSSSSSSGGSVYVRGYYRKDGTYVRPHTRRR